MLLPISSCETDASVQLSVIIVSYNVKYYLRQCLDSVRAASDGLSVQVLVIDNDSKDGTVEYLEPLFQDVTFLRAGGNLGFSKANNKALEYAMGKYVLFLNPDTIVGGDVLSGCIGFFESHPEAGAAGVKMLNADGSFARESRRALPTPWVSVCKMTGLTGLFPKSRMFGRYYMDYLPRDKESQIEVISGAFMMVRRAVLESIGGFDESFFMYGEDVDLSYRILKAGWQNWYLPLTILHYKGESTNKTSYRYAKVFYQAMSIFFEKHYSRVLSFAVKAVVSVQAVLTYLISNIRGGAVPSDTGAGGEWKAYGTTRLPDSLSLAAELSGHYVFDTLLYNWSEILSVLEGQTERLKLGTYNPRAGLFMTERVQIELSESDAVK